MAGIARSFSKGMAAINVKTSVFMEENKCNTYIAAMEEEIQKLKLEAGETLYRAWASGDPGFECAERTFQQIREREQEIDMQRQRILQLHEEEKRILGSDRMAAAASPIEGPRMYCAQCGAPNRTDYKFCVKCGRPLG